MKKSYFHRRILLMITLSVGFTCLIFASLLNLIMQETEEELSPMARKLLERQKKAVVKWTEDREARRSAGIDTPNRRFAAFQGDIGTFQFPLLPELASSAKDYDNPGYVSSGKVNGSPALPYFTLTEPAKAAGKKFAYAWFASSSHYLCSAIVASRHLRPMRSNSTRSGSAIPELSVDFLLLRAQDDLTSDLDTKMLDLWVEDGGKHHITDSFYYRGALQKFRSFLLTEYARVILMDSDGLSMADLDHLFLLELPPRVAIAAPQAYWEENGGVLESGFDTCKDVKHVAVAGGLWVIEPSAELYNKTASLFGSKIKDTGRQYYDMDIVNAIFSCNDEVLVLPKQYCTLDSDFTYTRLDSDIEPPDRFDEIQFLHLTANGKPWTRIIRSGYYGGRNHTGLIRAIDRWFEEADKACPTLLPPAGT